jgi:hypothetical protein
MAHDGLVSELSNLSDISAALILAAVAAWFPGSIIVFKAMEHFRLLRDRGERPTVPVQLSETP